MKSEILKLLDGINQTETEHDNGWWETSQGALFGQKRLDILLQFLEEHQERTVREAFLLGFMCSREGFNAECSFEHCSDWNGLVPPSQTEESFRESMALNEAFTKLQNAAVERITNA